MISQKKEKEFITYCCSDYDVAMYRQKTKIYVGAETKNTQHVKHKIPFLSNDTTWKYVTILLAFNSYIKIICSTLRFVRCFVSGILFVYFASRVSSHEHQYPHLLFYSIDIQNRKAPFWQDDDCFLVFLSRFYDIKTLLSNLKCLEICGKMFETFVRFRKLDSTWKFWECFGNKICFEF